MSEQAPVLIRLRRPDGSVETIGEGCFVEYLNLSGEIAFAHFALPRQAEIRKIDPATQRSARYEALFADSEIKPVFQKQAI